MNGRVKIILQKHKEIKMKQLNFNYIKSEINISSHDTLERKKHDTILDNNQDIFLPPQVPICFTI